jgi:D-alanine-D-alanine ligase
MIAASRGERALSVAVIFGGPSAEAEVSRVSATAIARALTEKGHLARLVQIDRFLADSLRDAEVAFPIAHGRIGEDGCLQGVLEWLAIPYVGSRVLASALAMDKWSARLSFQQAGLPIAPGILAPRGALPDVASLGERVVVKPRASGSAAGVTRIESVTDASLRAACEALWQEGSDALIERWCEGAEATCAVLDVSQVGGQVRALAPIEIESPQDAFYTFTARYAPGRSVHHCPARFSDAVREQIQTIALAAHRALGCRHLSRADVVVSADPAKPAAPAAVTLLEINTLPGFTPTSLFPEAALHAGIDFSSLCDALVRCAYAEGLGKAPTPLKFPTFTSDA